ncbi:zinc-dependent metalloprotease [Schaalia sp. lx-100]|uniref:zinc-dependent metalloprotease n=1 Tax=Schaalia sp. lx-100 TaxID=2899081 RepID=UPI001E294409|nr:zinc-dependent metalloprotease [Schaalia sp. lx-100]MCD4556782.1 zinc-dependent metalloprotease [Schaalia sp. lx-100]
MNDDHTDPLSYDDFDADNSSFAQFLRQLLGDEAADEAARALRASGINPQDFAQHFPSPAHMEAAIGQFQYLMSTSTEPVNWKVATDLARQQAYTAGDPLPSAAQAQRARQALTVADLWLDAVTDFMPGQVSRHVWSRTQWVDNTVDVWKRVCEPVAQNVTRALSEAIRTQFGDNEEAIEHLPEQARALFGHTQQMMPQLASLMFASQVGQALSALAQESFGSTDVGLPLAGAGSAAVIVHNIEAFADGLDIPFEEVQQYIALRECAHQRLFAAVPWLAGDLIRAVEKYSTHIAIDMDAISLAASQVDPSDPDSLEEALNGNIIFSAEPSPKQREALTRLETLLALVEGWVEVVTTQAAMPYLPHADNLREMMRRRRASGAPAEEILGSLIGLHMRPRRARGAAEIFCLVEAEQGRQGRDALWSHPHMIPTSEDLDSPSAFLVMRQAAQEQDADIDDALAALLDGTMGWAEGLTPDANTDPDASMRNEGPSMSDHDDEDDSTTN